MFAHPSANPVTNAKPDPVLYVHSAIFLAINAYAIPVPKNRTYTRTNPFASHCHPSTTRDATSGAISAASAPKRHT